MDSSPQRRLPDKLLAALSTIPENWALTPLGNNKNPYRPSWSSETPISRAELAEAIKHGELVTYQKKNGDYYTVRKYPQGFGLRTGVISGGIVAVDVDGLSAQKKLEEIANGEPLPDTVSFTSGRPYRCQLLFLIPEIFWSAVRTKIIDTGVEGEQLEFRWNFLQSAIPPSFHPDTGGYTYVHSPQEVAIAVCPMYLIELMLIDTEIEEESVQQELPLSEVEQQPETTYTLSEEEVVSLPNHPEQIEVPVSEAVPLLECCRKEVREWVHSGVQKGSGRNNAAIEVGLELVAVERHLRFIGQLFTDSARSLFSLYCQRSGMTAREDEERWRWCESKKPSTSCTPEGIENCIKGWYWREFIKPHRKATSQKPPSSEKASIDAEVPSQNAFEPNTSFFPGTSGRNRWNAPESFKGDLGFWQKKPKLNPATGEFIEHRFFSPEANFDFQVERELSDAQGGGIVIQIKRSLDKQQKRVVIASKDYTDVSVFTNALKEAYGSAIICNLSRRQVGALIQTRLIEYHDRGGTLYTLADRQGQQADGTWVFSDRQLDREGNPTTEEKSRIVFNPRLGGEDNIPAPEICAPDPQALPRLVSAMRRFHGESQIAPAIFTLGWVAATVNYQTIMQEEGRFPLLNLFGDPGVGKTVMAETALSVVGWLDEKGMFSHITESAIYERLKHSSLPFCYDDPQKSPWLDTLIQRVYNGYPRIVRENAQTPRTSLMVTSNHAIGDERVAVLSRFIQLLILRSTDGDKGAWQDLMAARKKASGALPQLIKLGYHPDEVKELASKLHPHLPHAHGRVADSLGLILWYALAVCRLAGVSETLMTDYVINVLCKTANDADSAADSLTDFLDKVNALHSQSKVGEWDIRLVETRTMGKAIAINMSSVWSQIETTFNVPYSRQVIEGLIEKAGGKKRSTAKFHRSQDESKAFRRMLLTSKTGDDGAPLPICEPEFVSRRCALIPVSLVADFLTSWKEQDPPYNQYQSPPATTESPSVTTESPSPGDWCNQGEVRDEEVLSTPPNTPSELTPPHNFDSEVTEVDEMPETETETDVAKSPSPGDLGSSNGDELVTGAESNQSVCSDEAETSESVDLGETSESVDLGETSESVDSEETPESVNLEETSEPIDSEVSQEEILESEKQAALSESVPVTEHSEEDATSDSHESPTLSNDVNSTHTYTDEAFIEFVDESNRELSRLGWSKDYAKDVTRKRYGKDSRQLMSDQELEEFVRWLRSLPTPVADGGLKIGQRVSYGEFCGTLAAKTDDGRWYVEWDKLSRDQMRREVQLPVGAMRAHQLTLIKPRE